MRDGPIQAQQETESSSEKKTEIVKLDDVKEDVELLKNVGHRKDHWVIQLISI